LFYKCRGGEKVDTRDLKSLAPKGRAGSIPALGTNIEEIQYIYINNLGMTGIDWWISSLI
jgi:hypothetical protein